MDRSTKLKAFVTFLAVWAWLAVGARPAHALLSRSDEIRIGREAAAEYEEEVSLSGDPSLTDKVERIGRRLVAVSDAPDLPFEFHVVNTHDLNAGTFPGGIVYVNRGLIEAMPSDDALAFVLGHEISHATKHHWVKGTRRDLLYWTALAPISMSGASSLAADVLNVVLQRGYSRHAENEADATGFKYMVAAGYDPRGAAQSMETLKALSRPESRSMGWLRDHPYDEERIAHLKALAQAALAQAKESPARPVPPAAPLPDPGDVGGAALAANAYFPLAAGNRWTYRDEGPNPAADRTTVAVLEQTPTTAGDIYRVSIDLGGGLAFQEWEATTATGLLRRPTDPHLPRRWSRVWDGAVLPLSDESGLLHAESERTRTPPPAETGRIAPITPSVSSPLNGGRTVGAALSSHLPLGVGSLPIPTGEEIVIVPAGTFLARKLERKGPDGAVEETVWVARSVGVVKRLIAGTSAASVLDEYRVRP